MLKIGEFSKLSGLSVDTLYHYEKMKILVPYEIDKFSGYRNYNASQLVTVNKLLALKDAGFSLQEIAEFIYNNPPVSSLLKTLEEKALLLESELNDELSRLERLHTNIFLIKNGGIPLTNDITIKQVEPILAATVRKTFNKEKFDSELDIMWADLNQYIKKKGGKRTIPCMMIYHKGWVDLSSWIETGIQPLDVEVVEPIIKTFAGSSSVNVYTIPAVKVACIIHKGSFSTINSANEALFKWIKKNNYAAGGAMREIYHKGEWATDNPDEYITELQIPLRKE